MSASSPGPRPSAIDGPLADRRLAYCLKMPIDLEALIEDIRTVLGILDVDSDVAQRTAVDIVSLPSMIELRRLAEIGETVEG